jgi:hypothetical protein
VSVLQLPRVTTPPIDPGNGTLRDPLAVEIVEGGRGLQARVQPIDVDLARKLAAEGADPSDGSGETQEERLRLRVVVEVAEDIDFRVSSRHARRVQLM